MQISKTQQRLEVNEGNNKQPMKELPRAIAALGYRNFRLFWFGQIISLIGTWTQSTGQSWLVLKLSHNAFWLGFDGALQFIPVLLFSLFNGVIADRLPKRNILIFTQTSAMVLASILFILIATNVVQLWQVFILSALLGITNSLDMPVRQAFVVEMVGRETLPNAIALNSTSFNMARIIGPSIAGLIIGLVGEAPLFFINALSFIPVIIGIFLMRPAEFHNTPKKQTEESMNVFKSLGEGFRYMAHTPALFLIITVLGVISLFGINFNVMLPLFADEVLHIGAQGFGFLSSSFGVGAFLAALWMAWRSHKPSISFLLINALFFGVVEMLFAISHLFVLSLVLIAAVGFTQISFAATANAAVQTVTPNHLRGRIMGVYIIVFVGTTPFGNMIMGGLASTFGATIALLSGAIPSLAAAAIAWFMRKPAEKSLNENKIKE
jgi:MFS family permease